MDWNIQSRTHVCQISGERFQDGDIYHTVLLDGGREGLRRMDVSAGVWSEKFEGRAHEETGYISHWQGTYRVPPPPPPEPIQKESAETLFRRLVELNDPRYTGAVYILAVMLERKRILKVQSDVRKDDERIFVYEHVRTKDVYPIAEVSLELDELDTVQQQVADLLEHGLTEVGEIAFPEPEPEPCAVLENGEAEGEDAALDPGEDSEQTTS